MSDQLDRFKRSAIILAMEHAESRIRGALVDVDRAIMTTPTSPCREHLTEANIHLMAAAKALGEAEKVIP